MTQTMARPEAPELRPPARHRRSPWVAMLLLVALAITLAGIFPFRQMIAQERQVENTQARLDALIAENEQLAERVTALNTDAEVERIARENGLVRPGETSYTVELEPGEITPAPAVSPAETLDDRSLLRRFWTS